jgi:lysozyme family protein
VTILTTDFFPGQPLGFRRGMRFIWQPENDGHDEDSAPGEAFLTRWGVTRDTWDDAVRAGVVAGQLEDATPATIGNLYLARFWNAMMLDAFPTALGFVLFGDATLTGTGHVASLLQRIVGAADDGVIGKLDTVPKVATYLSVHGQTALVDAIIDADETYLAALVNAPKFLAGWTRREEEEQAIAHDIIASEILIVPEPEPESFDFEIVGVGRWTLTPSRAA